MIATRYLHRSDVALAVGDELLSPAALCALHEGANGGPRAYSNWPEYCDRQHECVYFSMTGSRADEITYTYYGRKFTYIVEPLGPVEPDPEDELQTGRGPSGSLRCERAVIREKHHNHAFGPRLEDGMMRRPPVYKLPERGDEIRGGGLLKAYARMDAPAYKKWEDNLVQCAKIGEAFKVDVKFNLDALPRLFEEGKK